MEEGEASNLTTLHNPVTRFWSDQVDAGAVASAIFALVFLWWFIYSLVIAYHWFRFGRESWVALPAVAAHVFISGWIIFYLTSGLH